MSAQCETTARKATTAPMSTFERYLTVWVFACILAGIAAGQVFPGMFRAVGRMEIAQVTLLDAGREAGRRPARDR